MVRNFIFYFLFLAIISSGVMDISAVIACHIIHSRHETQARVALGKPPSTYCVCAIFLGVWRCWAWKEGKFGVIMVWPLLWLQGECVGGHQKATRGELRLLSSPALPREAGWFIVSGGC